MHAVLLEKEGGIAGVNYLLCIFVTLGGIGGWQFERIKKKEPYI